MSMLKFMKQLLEKIGFLYVRWLCKREYELQSFIGKNERSIEFSFLFRKLTDIWPKKVLDVGTGKTALPHLIRNCGFIVTAIDNIKDYWPKGMVNRHYHIINDDITNSALTEKYDFISCISVIEHIQDHQSAMYNMSKLLIDGGDLVITFPYSKNKYCSNVYELPKSNVSESFSFKTQSFSKENIALWSKACGLEVVEQEFWDFFEGDYWTCGDRLIKPAKVNSDDKYQLTCVHFKKIKSVDVQK